MSDNGSFSNHDPKVIGIISYLFLLGWIVAVVLNKNKDAYASFHIRQALGIHLLSAISGLILSIPILGWVGGMAGWALALVLWIIGFMSALHGEEKEVPVLGAQFQEWFKAL